MCDPVEILQGGNESKLLVHYLVPIEENIF